MERLAGAGKSANVFPLETLLLGEGVDELVGEPVGVAATLRGHGNNRSPRGIARTKRILIGVDDHGAGGKLLPFAIGGSRSEQRLIDDTKGGGGGRRNRQLQEHPAGIVAKGFILAHANLPEARQDGIYAHHYSTEYSVYSQAETKNANGRCAVWDSSLHTGTNLMARIG